MQTSQKHQSSGSIQRFCHHPMPQFESRYSHFQILNNDMCASMQNPVTFPTLNGQFYTLESSPAPEYMIYDSPSAISFSPNGSSFSTQQSQSYISDPHKSLEVYGSPLSGCSVVDDDNNLMNIMMNLEREKLLGPELEMEDSDSFSFCGVEPTSSLPWWKQILEMAPHLDLKKLLLYCAEAVSESDLTAAQRLMEALERRVSISGDPIERLGAYMLEGLRARLLSSGSIIYNKLKCSTEPTSKELMSYMHVLYEICPYYKFAYRSSNVMIEEAMVNESRIHIIDFQIAQGSQWMGLIQALARRPGGPPLIRITGVDDSQSAHARGGGLDLLGERLIQYAKPFGVQLEFHAAAMSGCEVELSNLGIQPGEALAVNFPYMLHHMPDESVTTTNHRDRLLRLVKSLSPKIVTLVEQESNTNTAPFFLRFRETLDYYEAMFESIDVARPQRDESQRIRTEENCVARDVVNIIACEEEERVERHEVFGKWRSRLLMAGFSPCPLSSSVSNVVKDTLKEYNSNYKLWHMNGALYLGWKNRAMATSSAWR